MDQDSKQLLLLKGRLLQTTTTPGWTDIKRFANRVVQEMVNASVDEMDDQKAQVLRGDARGARKFMEDLFKRIEMAKNLDDPSESFFDIAVD